MAEWGLLSVPQAAARLGVSSRRVRQLLDVGELTGVRLDRHVLVDAASVARRVDARPPAGRPLSPQMAWAAVTALERPTQLEMGDRRLRHRLAGLLSPPRDVDDWVRLCRRRAAPRRYWAHPGVVTDLLADPAVSVGRARAAALAGLDVAPGDDAVAYVAAAALPDLEVRYGLQPDPAGQVELRMVGEDAGPFGPVPGAPVPLAAAVLDMAESDDARMRALARSWLRRAVVAAHRSAEPRRESKQ